jgi:hypothetical protein
MPGGNEMSVKEDWRRPQTVSDEQLEENWKLMFGTSEPVKNEIDFNLAIRQDPTCTGEKGYEG